jgi:hypothetical protein
MSSESANGGLHDEEKTQTIRLFGSHEAAEIAAAKVNAHGIQCWVHADDCAGMYPSLTTAAGVRLNVRTVDAEAVTALLDSMPLPDELNQLETEALASAPEEKILLKKLAWVQILIGIGIGVFLCLMFQGNSKQGTKSITYLTAEGKDYGGITYRGGHAVKAIIDRNMDGIVDEWIYYKNDHVERSEYDNNFDGKPDEWVIYSNSSPVSSEKDTDYNGSPDVFCSYSNGIIQQVDYRPNGIKFTTTREIFKNGVLTEIWRCGDSQGFFNEVVKYDAFFNEGEKRENKDPSFNPISSNPISSKSIITNTPATPMPFQLLSPIPK